MQKIQEQKASDFIAPKNITSSLQTLSNYNKTNISFKSKSFSEQKKIFQEKLESERDKDGLRIFYYDTINATIMRKLTPENIDLAEKLCFAKDANGKQLHNENGEPRMYVGETSVRAIKAVLPAMINEGLSIEADDTGKEFVPVENNYIFRMNSF